LTAILRQLQTTLNVKPGTTALAANQARNSQFGLGTARHAAAGATILLVELHEGGEIMLEDLVDRECLPGKPAGTAPGPGAGGLFDFTAVTATSAAPRPSGSHVPLIELLGRANGGVSGLVEDEASGDGINSVFAAGDGGEP
jgi:hypothetical protein